MITEGKISSKPTINAMVSLRNKRWGLKSPERSAETKLEWFCSGFSQVAYTSQRANDMGSRGFWTLTTVFPIFC